MTASIRDAARALGGEVAGRNRVLCPGPGHSRRDRSLAVTFTDTGFLVHSFANDDWRECRDHVKAALGLSDGRTVALNDNTPAVDHSRLLDEERRIDEAAAIWGATVPLPGTLGETYLSSRRLAYAGDEIRYHPGRRMMVAMMTDAATGEPCGVHRTFLDRDGGKVDRKMLGRASGAVVRLSADEDVSSGLAIAEGIETALATPCRPVWACLSAGTMKSFPVLAGIDCLTIFADNDPSGAGLRAARECAERWHAAGREVVIRMVDADGCDYADVVAEVA
jgi:hypothetical protein